MSASRLSCGEAYPGCQRPSLNSWMVTPRTSALRTPSVAGSTRGPATAGGTVHVADDAGWIAFDDREGRDRLPYDGAGTDIRPLADLDCGQDGRVRSDHASRVQGRLRAERISRQPARRRWVR